MVRQTTLEDKRKELIEELLKTSDLENICPYIKKDKKAPYCSKDLTNSEISEKRRMVCDLYSLQIWCLTKNYPNCIFYQGEPIN